MPKQKIFDAHHHLWDLNVCRYPWLMARGVKRFFGDPSPIQKDYLATDLVGDANTFHLVGSTHIQVGVEEEDSVKETLWLQEVSDTTPHLPHAIVAFADLTKENLEDQLEKHQGASNVRGIRQIVGRHPVEDAQTKSGALLDNPRFLTGLKTLERKALRFDLQLVESQYQDAASLLSTVPNLNVAICHFASPWDLSNEGFGRWREAMGTFASLPNVHMKFSGFGMFKNDWNASDIEPYVDTALSLFGPARCMAGSNFPVDKLYGGYDRIWNALTEIIADQETLEHVSLTNGPAFYDVEVPVN